jgi:hypothetical protein
MVESWENKPTKEIRQAIDIVLAKPGFSTAAAVLDKYLKAFAKP